jgi:diguanylate cyclase (GGDEF)-like protein
MSDNPTTSNPADPDIDLLTGLPTRPALYRTLALALEKAASGAPSPALLALDLDRFQSVNDSSGIATGDGVLRRVARRLQSAMPPGATVARISGDEFAVLLPDAAAAGSVAARLLDLVGRTYAVNGNAVTLSVSIGVACAPGHGTDADALLRSANIALHRAEAEGKNKWCLFEHWMREHASARQALEMDLRTALGLNKNELRGAMGVDQFEVYYQPQATLDGRCLTGFEALVRWRHPQRGLVEPEQFIALAEEIGLIGLLGDWVLRTACRAAASWPGPVAGAPLAVSVNVSPLQLRERRALVAGIAQVLEDTGLDGERLDIEITESALIGDAQVTLAAIKALGVRLTLDDFGTGYSSLSQLVRYPFDRLKIDASFVRRLPSRGETPGRGSAQAQALWMVQAIASLGSGLHMSTVAEGIETEQQAAQAMAAGVDQMQGFLVARPMPEAEIPAFIERFGKPRPGVPPATPTSSTSPESSHDHPRPVQPRLFQHQRH